MRDSEKKIRILEISFLDPYITIGGVEHFVVDLTERLTALGAEVFHSYLRTSFKRKLDGEKYKKDDLTLYLPGRVTKGARLFSKVYFNIALPFFVWANRSRYDIIHINADNGGLIPVFNKIGTVMTAHGSSILAMNNFIKYGVATNYISMRVSGIFENIGIRYSNQAVTVSAYVANFFWKIFSKKLEVIPLVVDLTDYGPADAPKAVRQELEMNNGGVQAIWVGADPLRKELKLAMDAVSYMNRTTLYVIGTEATNRDNVRALGRIDEDLLIKYMQASDVLLFPSVSEAYGIAVVKAMSCGCVPILRPFFKEIFPFLEDGKNCMIADSLDEFRDKLHSIESDEVDLETMRNEILKDVSQVNLMSSGEAYLKMFRECLQ